MRRQAGKSRSTGFFKVVNVWLLQHAQAFFFSLGQLCKNPAGTLLTTAVVGISLALPTGLYSFLENTRRVTADWDAASHISLFLTPEISEQRARSLAARLQTRNDVRAVEVISPAAALIEFKQHSGLDAALEALERNPLPAVLMVQPEIDSLSSGDNARLLETLRELPEVDAGQFDRQWAQRLRRIIELFQHFTLIVGALLAVAVGLVVGNTMRLALHSRRQEIEINKLFGATDAFIRRPFLYSGLLYGGGGALLAWLLLEAATLLLNKPAARLAELYGSDFTLEAINAAELGVLLLAGMILGLVGAWASVKRHLKAVDP